MQTIHTTRVHQEAHCSPRVVLFVTPSRRHNDHSSFLIRSKLELALPFMN